MGRRLDGIRFPARFYRDPEDPLGRWLVELPGLEGTGLAAFGDTLAEARRHAQEVLTLYLESGSTRELDRDLDALPPQLQGEKGWEWVRPDASAEVPLMIRQLRRQAGLSQKQAATRLGVPQTTWQKWEDPARCNATLDTLGKVARTLGRVLEVTFR